MKKFLIWIPRWYRNNKGTCIWFSSIFTCLSLSIGLYDHSTAPAIWIWLGTMSFGLIFLVWMSYLKRNSP